VPDENCVSYILITIAVLLALYAYTKAQDISQLIKVRQSKEEIVEVVGTLPENRGL
jgi:hypothetical protein